MSSTVSDRIRRYGSAVLIFLNDRCEIDLSAWQQQFGKFIPQI